MNTVLVKHLLAKWHLLKTTKSLILRNATNQHSSKWYPRLFTTHKFHVQQVAILTCFCGTHPKDKCDSFDWGSIIRLDYCESGPASRQYITLYIGNWDYSRNNISQQILTCQNTCKVSWNTNIMLLFGRNKQLLTIFATLAYCHNFWTASNSCILVFNISIVLENCLAKYQKILATCQQYLTQTKLV